MIEILKIALFVLMLFALVGVALIPVIIGAIRDYYTKGDHMWFCWVLLITVPLAIGIGAWVVNNYSLMDWFFT